MLPETKYVRSGAVNIAYQIIGDGPRDLIIVPGFISHLEQAWDEPGYARFLQRLASFSRLIRFDKRGTGLSDRVAEMPSLEQRMDDVRAVMHAAGSNKATLFGVSEGGPMSVLFAATYPDRTEALILYGSMACGNWAPDYPWVSKRDAQFDAWLDDLQKQWGGPFGIEMWAPSVAHDTRFRDWFGRHLRLGASPGAAASLIRMNTYIDVRDILPAIRVPTLVLHRVGDRAVDVQNGRYLANHIPGARFAELSGDDHVWWVGDTDSIVDEVEELLTGERHVQDDDRVLVTVLFTDIVDSTRRAVELGDRRWHDLLDSHNLLMQTEIGRHGGRAVKSTGDGFLATFDGPARAIRCACAASREVHRLGIDIRCGLHTGEVELVGTDVSGITVHTAARVLAEARADEVWVSRTVKDLVAGSRLRFSERGTYSLKGVAGDWMLFAVEH